MLVIIYMIFPKKIIKFANCFTIDSNGDLIPIELPTNNEIINPYDNTKHIFEYYKYLATSAPIDELKAFADYLYHDINKYKFILSREDLYFFQLHSLNQDNYSDEDIKFILSLKNDPFYSDALDHGICCNTILFYLIGKVELRAFRELDEIELNYLKYWWICSSDDLLDTYISFDYHKIVADAYDILGYHWFIDEAWNDIVRYKYVIDCINCKIKFFNSKDNYFQIKDDLFEILQSIILNLSMFKNHTDYKYALNLVKQSIISFDSKTLEILSTEIIRLKNKNLELKNNVNVLHTTINELKNQIKDLRKLDKYNSDSHSLINAISSKIYSVALPQTNNCLGIKFDNIWKKLLHQSQLDINAAISFADNFSVYDINLLLFFRTLEREFKYKFIHTFQNSNYFKNITDYNCYEDSLLKIHNSLCDNKFKEFSIGTIPFIGRAINNKDNYSSSSVLYFFTQFLGSKKKVFCNICKDINSYKISVNKYKIYELRNAIAHGDDSIISLIDNKLFNDIKNVFFEPPLKILSNIINFYFDT
jgi:hypothetical protein